MGDTREIPRSAKKNALLGMTEVSGLGSKSRHQKLEEAVHVYRDRNFGV